MSGAGYDSVFLQSELIPWVPFELERLFFQYKRVAVDYDDATYESYSTSPLLKNKIARVMGSAAQVICGNHRLAAYARRFNPNVTVIPTVIDLDRYQPRMTYSFAGKAVVGWIGTPITARYLDAFAPVLRAAARKAPFILGAVGVRPDYRMEGVETEAVAWSEHSEADVIRSFDVGIMPVVDEPFAHGKSGLKLIQYMGAGVPALGSAIGANREIIADGLNGLLAESQQEFEDKLVALLGDVALREQLGKAGRDTVASRYSVESQKDRFVQVIERAAGR